MEPLYLNYLTPCITTAVCEQCVDFNIPKLTKFVNSFTVMILYYSGNADHWMGEYDIST